MIFIQKVIKAIKSETFKLYLYIHTRKRDDGRKLVLGGNLDQAVSRDKFYSNIWTVFMISEAKGSG